MSEGTNKKNIAKGGEAVKGRKRLSGTAIFLISFAIVSLIGIIASIIAAVVVNMQANYRIDYLKDDLSRYVYISADDYKSFDVIASVDTVDELDIENAIIQVLCANKNKEALEDGARFKNKTVTVGDVLEIYYRGYTLDEDGNKIDFDGGCNFSGDVADLEIGSGAFVPGFELNLIGENSKNYSTLQRLESQKGDIGESDVIYVTYNKQQWDTSLVSGKSAVIDLSDPEVDLKYGIGFKSQVVGKSYGSPLSFSVEEEGREEKYMNLTAYRTTAPDSVIHITYSAFYHDGTVSQKKTAIVDLSNTNLDKTWGVGFAEFFSEARPVGTQLKNEKDKALTLTTKTDDGDNSYYDITIDYVFEVGDNPLTVDAYFPKDYQSEELRGVNAKFDVYIRTSQLYDAQEFNDTFITDTLKLKAEDLSEYEGETLTEKYRSKLESELVDKYNETIDNAIDEAMWEHYVKKAAVKKLPSNEVKEYYDRYLNDINVQYASYTSYYSSVDDFAIAYLGLNKGADWKAVLMKNAEGAVTQKLIFYYVIRQEGLTPDDEEYEDLYNGVVDEHLESYLKSSGIVRDKYKTEEEYNAAVKKAKEQVIGYYGEDYFRENIYFEYAAKTVRTWAKVTLK